MWSSPFPHPSSRSKKQSIFIIFTGTEFLSSLGCLQNLLSSSLWLLVEHNCINRRLVSSLVDSELLPGNRPKNLRKVIASVWANKVISTRSHRFFSFSVARVCTSASVGRQTTAAAVGFTPRKKFLSFGVLTTRPESHTIFVLPSKHEMESWIFSLCRRLPSLPPLQLPRSFCSLTKFPKLKLAGAGG